MYKYYFYLVTTFFLATILSCGQILLPSLSVNECTWNSDYISVFFSDEPCMTSVQKSFSLTENTVTVQGIFTLEKDLIKFFPCEGIKKNKDYVLTISSSAESKNGNSLLVDYNFKFSTRENSCSPEIIFINPKNETYTNDKFQEIEIAFSKKIKKESIATAISLSPAFSYLIDYQTSNTLTDKIKIIPCQSLIPNTQYMVTISESLEDSDGIFLSKKYESLFYYDIKSEVPECKFFLEENAASKEIENNSTLKNVALDASVKISFSSEINLENLSSHIMISPPLSYNIKKNPQDSKNATLSFTNPKWNEAYSFRMMQGLSNIHGKKTNNDIAFTLCFDNEANRPCQFREGFFQTGDWQENFLKDDSLKNDNEYKHITRKNNFSTINFDPLFYTVESEKSCLLYLIFDTSTHSSGIDLFSILDAISLSSTNNCCSLIIKTMKVLERSEYESIPIKNKIEIHGGTSIVQLGIELKNNSNPGLIHLNLKESIKDTLGNKIISKEEFTFSK